MQDIQFASEQTRIQDDLLIIAGDNALDSSFSSFLIFAEGKRTSCVITHEKNDLKKAAEDRDHYL